MTEQYLQLLPVTADDMHPGTPNPEFIIALNERLNAQAGRITPMLQTIEETNPNKIGYADIMHWKARYTYLRNVGQAKAAQALAKAEALKEAKADKDDEKMEAICKDAALILQVAFKIEEPEVAEVTNEEEF